MIFTSYVLYAIIENVGWDVEIGDKFEPEFKGLPGDVRTEILTHALLLQQFGPQLGRPRVDTLNDSRPRQYEGAPLQCGGW